MSDSWENGADDGWDRRTRPRGEPCFLNEGAKVVVTYRNEAEMKPCERRPAGTRSVGWHCGRPDADAAAEQLVSKIAAQYGRLDVLVNAIGAYAGGIEVVGDGCRPSLTG